MKDFLITGSHDGVEELTVHEESMDPASEGGLEEDMLRPDAYFILSLNATQRVFHLNSAWDEHPSSSTDVSSLLKTPHLNKMQCDLLVQYLRNSMDEVKKQIRSNPKPASVETLTEYYRIVIACEKLILQCCNENWQRAAIWVMDWKPTFVLRISELLWCTAIIAKTTWEDAAFTEKIDEISCRLSDYAEKDHNLLKKMLEDESVVDSRHSGDLVAYLSRRADAKGDAVVECPPELYSMERDAIGQGAFGIVYKALMFNESVAVKMYHQDNLALSEASIMAKLNHPGIVPLLGVSSDPKKSYLIMELMSGDLKDLINSRSQGGSVSPFSLHVCVDIMLQIAEVMRHVHDVGLVHRNLKSANILFKVVADKHLSKAGFVVVKVGGFGSANQYRVWELSSDLEYVGTSVYMAPELHSKYIAFEPVQMRNSNVVDVYNFGLVCYEILSGKHVFDDLKLREVRKLVCDGDATCPRLLASLIGECLLTSLIGECWASDPNSRPDFKRICRELKEIKTMLITGSSTSMNL